ncbi:MAG: murein biosynthesis integral membrane protein MurJ [Candidatus Vogelbacteria bacterium]|nr:murein biosynthesis integral membrane protein MurJ [Candidatus Vogelbacteria bacterium]
MVKKFLNFISKEFSGLHQTAFLLSLASLVSQLLGLFRDRLLAHTFGASATLDLYYAAFRIPDLIFVSVGSFLAVTVLIPILIERGKQNDISAEKKFMDSLFTFFLLVMAPTMLLAFIFAPVLDRIFVPGFSDAQQIQLLSAVRILLFSPLFLGLSSLFGSVTQARRKFMIFAISPILYNLGIIGGIVFMYPIFGIQGLIYGVVFGAFLHMIIQVPTMFSSGLFPRIISEFHFQDIKTIMMRSMPRTLGLGALQLSVTFLITEASYMAAGSIAVFNFAYNLQSVPISLVGISYSVAAFPLLSRLNAEGKMEEFARCVEAGIRHILFWILPFVSLLIVLRAQIVRIILGSGHFSWNDTRLTAACLALFSFGVIFQNVVLMLDRSYYARHKTKVPVITNLLGSVTIILSAVLLPRIASVFPVFFSTLVSFLKVKDVTGTEVLFLPLAFSIGAAANFLLEWSYFKKDLNTKLTGELKETLTQSLASSIIMAAIAHASLFGFARVFNLNTFIGVLFQGGLSGVLAVAGGIITLISLKNRETSELIETFKKKIGFISITIPGQDQL